MLLDWHLVIYQRQVLILVLLYDSPVDIEAIIPVNILREIFVKWLSSRKINGICLFK